jgi:hypothetical protein
MVGGRPEKQAAGDDHKKGGGEGAGHYVGKTKGSRTNHADKIYYGPHRFSFMYYLFIDIFNHDEICF